MSAWVWLTHRSLARWKSSVDSASTPLAVMALPMEGARKMASLTREEELVSMNMRSITRSMASTSWGRE